MVDEVLAVGGMVGLDLCVEVVVVARVDDGVAEHEQRRRLGLHPLLLRRRPRPVHLPAHRRPHRHNCRRHHEDELLQPHAGCVARG